MMKICSVDGCEMKSHARGFCGMHYQRWDKDGHPGEAARRKLPDGITGCSVAGCTRDHYSSTLCSIHWERRRKHGDVGAVAPQRRRNLPVGHTELYEGYVYVKPSEEWIAAKGTSNWPRQHRVVMEEMLGRPIRTDESVHHINGNRQDNRPENLELWSRWQPAGQRVVDKLKWAREIIAAYEAEYSLPSWSAHPE